MSVQGQRDNETQTGSSPLSCPCRSVQESGSDSDEHGRDGTTVAFWPFFTHSATHRCVTVWTYSLGGVWCVKMQHICPGVTKRKKKKKKNSQKNSDGSSSCIAYLFIYLTLRNLYPPSHCACSPFFRLPNIHTFTYIHTELPRGLNCSLSCSTRVTGG